MEIQFEGDGFQPPRHGLLMLQIFIGIYFFVFLLRIWYLQILQADKYSKLAQDNRYREVSLYASRGFIFDKKGVLLARNEVAYALAFVREDSRDIPKTLAKISEWTDIPIEELEVKYKRSIHKSKPFQPVILVSDIPFHQVARIEAMSHEYPGIRIMTRPRRYYPINTIYSHILGYVAEVNDKELDRDPTLRVGDFIGKQGVELYLENMLRGEKGISQREVDASGRILLEEVLKKPVSGNNLTLSVDTVLQQKVWDILGDRRATVVVMNPYTGKILSLVNRPSYDNNLFTRKLTNEEWVKIRDDERNPLHNKAVQGAYPPASVWKIPMVTMLLERGVDPNESVRCTGEITVGNQVFRCWQKSGHGQVNMRRSVVVSCDVYYYLMAERYGIQYLSDMAKEYGFGQRLGLSLPYEHPGIVPNPEWKKARFKRNWHKGETINFSIGQGYTLVTPMQIASFLSGLINEGKEIRPSFLEYEEPEVMRILPIQEKHRLAILEYMEDTVTSNEGTARVLRTPGVIVGGKTGTAQVTKLRIIDGRRVKAHELPEKFRDHAWMAAYATKGEQTYVIVVLVEHGGGGGAVAGPIAKAIIDTIFSSTYQAHLLSTEEGKEKE